MKLSPEEIYILMKVQIQGYINRNQDVAYRGVESLEKKRLIRYLSDGDYIFTKRGFETVKEIIEGLQKLKITVAGEE